MKTVYQIIANREGVYEYREPVRKLNLSEKIEYPKIAVSFMPLETAPSFYPIVSTMQAYQIEGKLYIE